MEIVDAAESADGSECERMREGRKWECESDTRVAMEGKEGAIH